MRTFKTLLWAMLPVFVLALAVGCKEDPETPVGPTKDSVIRLSKTTVNASLAGDTYLLEYTIENPHEGEKISAEAAESWVKDFNYGITGALGFTVEPNSGTEARQCLVTVKYRYAEDAVFVVKQGAKVSDGFVFENIEPELFTYSVDVIPENKTLPYIVMSADINYVISNELTSGEALYEDDYSYFGWLGTWYKQSAVEVMQTRSKIGDQNVRPNDSAAAGVPHIFYCYYFDWESGALISDVAQVEITTLKPEQTTVTFDMKYEVDACAVSADVVPIGFDGPYYFDMLNGVLVDYFIETFDFINTPEDAVEYYWATAVQEMMFLNTTAMSGADIINSFNCQGTYPDGSPRSHYDFELLANHTYYLFAFSMNEYGLYGSRPQVVKVETEGVPMSDNVITPSVTKITAETATINFTTTVAEDYYIAGWEKASDWATYGNTDAERQEYLLGNNSYELIKGDYSQNVIGLEADTEYVLYAFGSRGGVATTAQIFTCPFKTKSGAAGAATIEFVDHGYFDAADLALLPGWEQFGSDYYSDSFIHPLEFKIEGEYQSFFATVWNWTGRPEEELYTDRQYLDNLVWSINEYGSMNTDKSYTILENNSRYIFVAMVVDTDGMYSNLAKLEVNTSYDGARKDPEAFDEWWHSDNGSVELQSLVIDDEPSKQLFRKKSVKNAKFSETTANPERRALSREELPIER